MATQTKQSQKTILSRLPIIIMCISLILVLVGAGAANLVHTSGGSVVINDIQFVTEDGGLLRALLYVPKTATPSSPAPAVVACHGYNNTAEVQDLNCVELSKRGFVVIALDAYGHGGSKFPDPNINKGIVKDMGIYAAMQYIGTLPYVDVNRIGMTGHSMGSAAIQDAALRAFIAQKTDPKVVVPAAILPTANSFSLDADGKLLLKDYPVNLGSVYGKFDEWAPGMWGVPMGSLANTTPRAAEGMGFANPEYDSYYAFGNSTKLDRTAAVEAANNKSLRIIYQPKMDHPKIHFSTVSAGDVIDFFDITLTGGQGTIPSTSQTWYWKQAFTTVSMIGFFLFIVSFGFVLLLLPYFKSIIKPEPDGLTATVSDGKSKLRYWAIYLIGLLPAPLIYNWAVGYSIDIKAMGRTVPIPLVANNFFQMPCVNGIVVFNILTGIIAVLLYLAVYFFFCKKAGCTTDNMGFKLAGKEIFKALVLAVTVFFAGYLLIEACDFFFLSDLRFFTLSIKTLTPAKFGILLKYVPFFLLSFLISGVSFNTFTRINDAKEWKNMILIAFSSVGGLLALHMIDYIALLNTGRKVFELVPIQGTTAALAGVLLWGLLFILPVSAIISRLFFKKTGSVWVGAFINAFVVTLYAISNTVIGTGMI